MKNTYEVFPKNITTLWIVNSLFVYIIISLPYFFIYTEPHILKNRSLRYSMDLIHMLAVFNLFLWMGLAFKSKKEIA